MESRQFVLRSAGGSAVAPTVVPHMAETPAKIAEAVPKDPLLEAFETQQKAVSADPGDFNKWVSLISAAEKLVRLQPLCRTQSLSAPRQEFALNFCLMACALLEMCSTADVKCRALTSVDHM